MSNILMASGAYSMQGKIISFSETEQQGIIIADDGIQYVFNTQSLTQQVAIKAGDNVDFSLDNLGHVNQLSFQSSPPQRGTLAELSNGLANTHSQNTTSPSLQKPSGNRYAPPSQSLDRNFDNQQNSALDAMYAEEQNYNMIDWTKKVVLKNYANFNGRARRKEYWWFYLDLTVLTVAAGTVDKILGTDEYGIVQLIISFGFFVPTIAAGARRLHDTGRSGWWQLLWLLPIIGWILVIIWLASDTSSENNKWGAPARRV